MTNERTKRVLGARRAIPVDVWQLQQLDALSRVRAAGLPVEPIVALYQFEDDRKPTRARRFWMGTGS